MPETDLRDIPFARTDGGETSLAAYAGKVVLIVNVASKCGFTKQYASLEAAYAALREEGFVVLGFPANNFAGQEPGDDAEIAEFCKLNYGVTFPVLAKISVAGEDRHPLYAALTAARPQASFRPESPLPRKIAEKGFAPLRSSDVLWNFEKFLLDRHGHVVGRFGSDVTVDDPVLFDEIKRLMT